MDSLHWRMRRWREIASKLRGERIYIRSGNVAGKCIISFLVRFLEVVNGSMGESLGFLPSGLSPPFTSRTSRI